MKKRERSSQQPRCQAHREQASVARHQEPEGPRSYGLPPGVIGQHGVGIRRRSIRIQSTVFRAVVNLPGQRHHNGQRRCSDDGNRAAPAQETYQGICRGIDRDSPQRNPNNGTAIAVAWRRWNQLFNVAAGTHVKPTVAPTISRAMLRYITQLTGGAPLRVRYPTTASNTPQRATRRGRNGPPATLQTAKAAPRAGHR